MSAKQVKRCRMRFLTLSTLLILPQGLNPTLCYLNNYIITKQAIGLIALDFLNEIEMSAFAGLGYRLLIKTGDGFEKLMLSYIVDE